MATGTNTKTGAGRQRKSQPAEAEQSEPEQSEPGQPEPEQPEPNKEPLPESEWPIPPGGGSYDLDVFTGELTLLPQPSTKTEE